MSLSYTRQTLKSVRKQSTRRRRQRVTRKQRSHHSCTRIRKNKHTRRSRRKKRLVVSLGGDGPNDNEQLTHIPVLKKDFDQYQIGNQARALIYDSLNRNYATWYVVSRIQSEDPLSTHFDLYLSRNRLQLIHIRGTTNLNLFKDNNRKLTNWININLSLLRNLYFWDIYTYLYSPIDMQEHHNGHASQLSETLSTLHQLYITKKRLSIQPNFISLLLGDVNIRRLENWEPDFKDQLRQSRLLPNKGSQQPLIAYQSIHFTSDSQQVHHAISWYLQPMNNGTFKFALFDSNGYTNYGTDSSEGQWSVKNIERLFCRWLGELLHATVEPYDMPYRFRQIGGTCTCWAQYVCCILIYGSSTNLSDLDFYEMMHNLTSTNQGTILRYVTYLKSLYYYNRLKQQWNERRHFKIPSEECGTKYQIDTQVSDSMYSGMWVTGLTGLTRTISTSNISKYRIGQIITSTVSGSVEQIDPSTPGATEGPGTLHICPTTTITTSNIAKYWVGQTITGNVPGTVKRITPNSSGAMNGPGTLDIAPSYKGEVTLSTTRFQRVENLTDKHTLSYVNTLVPTGMRMHRVKDKHYRECLKELMDRPDIFIQTGESSDLQVMFTCYTYDAWNFCSRHPIACQDLAINPEYNIDSHTFYTHYAKSKGYVNISYHGFSCSKDTLYSSRPIFASDLQNLTQSQSIPCLYERKPSFWEYASIEQYSTIENIKLKIREKTYNESPSTSPATSLSDSTLGDLTKTISIYNSKSVRIPFIPGKPVPVELHSELSNNGHQYLCTNEICVITRTDRSRQFGRVLFCLPNNRYIVHIGEEKSQGGAHKPRDARKIMTFPPERTEFKYICKVKVKSSGYESSLYNHKWSMKTISYNPFNSTLIIDGVKFQVIKAIVQTDTRGHRWGRVDIFCEKRSQRKHNVFIQGSYTTSFSIRIAEIHTTASKPEIATTNFVSRVNSRIETFDSHKHKEYFNIDTSNLAGCYTVMVSREMLDVCVEYKRDTRKWVYRDQGNSYECVSIMPEDGPMTSCQQEPTSSAHTDLHIETNLKDFLRNNNANDVDYFTISYRSNAGVSDRTSSDVNQSPKTTAVNWGF